MAPPHTSLTEYIRVNNLHFSDNFRLRDDEVVMSARCAIIKKKIVVIVIGMKCV